MCQYLFKYPAPFPRATLIMVTAYPVFTVTNITD